MDDERAAFERPQTPAEMRPPAVRRAEEMALVLAHQHDIVADVHQLTSGHALVSVCRGLLIYVDDENYRWTSPDSSQRGGPLLTYATQPANAAARIAQHYMMLRDLPADELLNSRLPLLTDVLIARHVCPI